MDWSMIAALAAVAGVFAAVAGVGAIVWQTFQTTRIQAFLQLFADWQSPRMERIRSLAAGSVLAKEFSPDKEFSAYIDEVLDFFETIAMLSKKWVLDKKIVWHSFYWPMVCYWQKTQGYIRDAQNQEGGETWKDYSDLMPKLIRREGSKLPTAESIDSFFQDEAGLSGRESV